jgi:hypothetical protein
MVLRLPLTILRMPDAYTVFWAKDRCAAAQPAIDAGERLKVLYGGPHISLPSYARAKVTAGDVVYPISVQAQAVYVLGRMRVDEVRIFDPDSIGRLYREHVDRHPRWRFLTGSCMDEVVLGSEGSVLRLDAAMSPDVLRRLTYRSQRGTRTVKQVSEDGRLIHSLSVQGIYRLASSCVADLDALVDR